MVAETAVEAFRVCLKNFKMSDEQAVEQNEFLETILGVKPEEFVQGSATVVSFLEKITNQLMKINRQHHSISGNRKVGKRTTIVKVQRRKHSSKCHNSERRQ